MAVSDEEHVRLVAPDQCNSFVVRRRAGRPRMRSHLKARVIGAQTRCELISHARRSPKQEKSKVPRGT
jgi:hypothetical protein